MDDDTTTAEETTSAAENATTSLEERGRPRNFVRDQHVPKISYVYGLHRGDERIVYVGISTQLPQHRLSVYKSPSSFSKGQPNRRTSEWIRQHFATVTTTTLAVLHDADYDTRRTTQLEWIELLTSDGHELLNSEIAGAVSTRMSRSERQEITIAIERLKPAQGEDLAVLRDTLSVKSVLGRIDAELTALIPKHVQWHIKRNLLDPECALCMTESESWRKQATPYAPQARQRVLGRTIAEAERAKQQRKTTVSTSAAVEEQASRAAATVAAITGPAAQRVEFVGIEVHKGTLQELGFDADGERDDAGHLQLTDRPPAGSGTVAETIAKSMSRTVDYARKTLPTNAVATETVEPSAAPAKPTEREASMERAVRDVLGELKFLVEFLENELL